MPIAVRSNSLSPWRRTLPLVLLLALCVAALPAAWAQEGADPAPGTDMTEEEINAQALKLSVEFMSPYCPGANLRDCTSGKAADLREEIRGWVADGRSRRWIEDELVSRYGQSILGAPRFEGFNALIWLAPFIALLVGAGLIFGYLRRQRELKLHPSTPARKVSESYQPDPEREAQLERELQDRGS